MDSTDYKSNGVISRAYAFMFDFLYSINVGQKYSDRYNTHATQRFIIYNFFFFLNDCIIISTTFFVFVFVFRLAAVSDPHLHHHTQIYFTFFSF